MTAKVILNPYASRWMAQKRQPEAEASLRTAGVDFEITVSDYEGHGIELAAEAAQAGLIPSSQQVAIVHITKWSTG